MSRHWCCGKCGVAGHNQRTCGRAPKVKQPRGGKRGPRKYPPGSSFALRLKYGRLAVQPARDTARDAAIQAMIDRHNAAKANPRQATNLGANVSKAIPGRTEIAAVVPFLHASGGAS